MNVTRLLLTLTLLFSIATTSVATGKLDTNKPMSVRMVESEMYRNPDGTYLDGMQGRLKWNYTVGLELMAFIDVYDRYGDERMWDYAVQFADTVINEKGEIYKYKKSNFNLDHLCPGKMLFRIYDRTGEKKYRRTLSILRDQLEDQPRTADGGFWHKQVYPHQMWLDGLYMGAPFYAEYIGRYDDHGERKANYEDVVNQFIVVAKHTYDPETKLYRHAWDESREMFWSDSETGQSKHAWGRALGWYVMGIVDALDHLPRNTKGREQMIEILRGIYDVLPQYADPETGMWYQVLDQPGREGNYVEGTASAMFVYAMLKGVRMGYLDKSLKAEAVKNYRRFLDAFVVENEDGTISIKQCCSVAGLGGKTMRKGDYEYYISEPVIDNDAKGVGPFIWASLEIEALNNVDYDPYVNTDRQIAFPGAEGGGMYASGGRGGRVIYVTDLSDDGSEGTLRHAIEQEGARTIMFKVSGNISLNKPLEIKNGNLTIAGQSAPGEGICIKDDEVFVEADNVIIRYLRFRLGDRNNLESDALGGRKAKNVMIDHCSISWSTDECASFYANRDFTMQWCIISESLNQSVHRKGAHGYGAIWGGRNASFHHNLFAHNNSRNPRFDHPRLYSWHDQIFNRGSVDFVNNVVYNWGGQAIYGGEEGWWNVRNNYFKPGAESRNVHKRFIDISVSKTTSMTPGIFHISGNVVTDDENMTADNWKGATYKGDYSRGDVEAKEPFFVKGKLNVESAEEAYQNILKYAGVSHSRDAIDKRIVKEVSKGTYTYVGSSSGMKGLIDSQADVGGWVRLKSKKAPLDSDGDGIPDKWEKRNGLNPQNPEDGAKYSLSEEYTNLEVYLNSLIK